jgi:cysteine desulfurase/selenocysteine lyase
LDEDAAFEARDAIKFSMHIEKNCYYSGCTEGINLVAQTWGRQNIRQAMRSLYRIWSIIPILFLVYDLPGERCYIESDSHRRKGRMMLDAYEAMLSEKTKLVSVLHVSNALGTINPVKTIVDKAHAAGAGYW